MKNCIHVLWKLCRISARLSIRWILSLKKIFLTELLLFQILEKREGNRLSEELQNTEKVKVMLEVTQKGEVRQTAGNYRMVLLHAFQIS